MALQALSPDELALLRKLENLPDKEKAEVMARFKRKTSDERQVWFCQRGRTCDGRPHEGAMNKHARGDQWPPPGLDWDVWFYMSGRGVGKTKAGGNWARMMARKTDRLALIGRRGKDVRQTMVEGPSGLIKTCEAAGETWDWKPSTMEFTFENGAKAFGYSAEEPESLRGPEHGGGWLDEPCHMDLIEEVWSNYNLGLRSEGVPGGAKTLLTSSPLPIQWTKDRIEEKGQLIFDELGRPIVDEETGELERAPKTVLVQVPTSVNLHNLDAGYKRRVINPLRGTRKGKQELDAVLLEDVEGALWEAEWLQRKRFKRSDMDRVVIAVDPSGSDSKTADLAGIVVVGKKDEEYFVFEDSTDSYTPDGWAREAIRLYEKYDADAIVLERYGGDSATVILRNTLYAGKKFKGKIDQVKARVGKVTRAEPVSALYEQRLVWHLERADLADLEDQMLTWVPAITKKSPDRIDALVWGLTQLSGRGSAKAALARPRDTRPPANRSPGTRYARRNYARGLR
ncbi:terminase [Microbacterium phage SadLad]|nr:terminase [Microbacterium phage SadLad]